MDINIFLLSFEKKLEDSGFSKEAAHAHTLKIAKSLTPADRERIDKITSPDEIYALASNYAKRATAKRPPVHEDIKAAPKPNAKPAEAAQPEDDVKVAIPGIKKAPSDVDAPTTVTPVVKKAKTSDEDVVKEYKKANPLESTKVISTNFSSAVKDEKDVSTAGTKSMPAVKRSEIKRVDFKNAANATTRKVDAVNLSKITKVALTPEGKKKYAKWELTHLPLTILLGLLAIIVVTAVYGSIAALITIFLLLLAATCTLGCAGGLAGFVYGVIKLFSVLPEGIYEIGLSFVIFGVTLALSICLYNISVRLIPILWKMFTKYLKKQKRRIDIYKNKIRTECNEK